MRILTWTLRIILFLTLFLLALKNTDSVSLQLYFDHVWQAPLILVLLVFFAAGAVVGVLATLGTIFRLRRDIARLQREQGNRPGDARVRTPVADGGIDSHSDI